MMHKEIILVLSIVSFVHQIASCEYSILTTNTTNDSIPFETRAYWMRVANKALSDLHSPCPFYAFGTAIVNHTANGLGELVCIGINNQAQTGNPSLHGEIAAIGNCSKILTAKNGSYQLSPEEALNAFSQLSLYSNGESCPMCASALRWAKFKEYIYGTSITTLIEAGWEQIHIRSQEIFSAAGALKPCTAYIPDILSNETDPYFMWQYNLRYPCPIGCRRNESDNLCKPF